MKYNFIDHKYGTTFKGVAFQLIINSTPKNLTGTVINMNVKNKKYPVKVNEYLSNPASQGFNKAFSTKTGEIVYTDAATGKFEFKKQIITLSPGEYIYEMVFNFPNGDIKKYLGGSWKIIA